VELRELVSFYHVARLRSVSKAARTLELGQPTVTTHLKKLEEEFSITLFDRIRRPIQLTSEGATLLELVSPVVQSVDTLKTQMDYAERRGSFVVGAYSDLVMHHLPKSIHAFRSRFPDVRIRLLDRPYDPLIQLVKSGEVDVALCAPPPPEMPFLQFQGLFPYNVVLLTPPKHPLLDKAGIELRDIAAYPLILGSPGSRTRQHMEQAMKAQGLDYDMHLSMESSELIKRYVEIGEGVAVFNDFALHPEDHDLLGVIRLDHLFTGTEIGICTLQGKFLGRAVRNFLEIMEGHLRGFNPGEWFQRNIRDSSTGLARVVANDS
jgi:DNA-binding transcriptional LysR family regulator